MTRQISEVYKLQTTYNSLDKSLEKDLRGYWDSNLSIIDKVDRAKSGAGR